MTMLNCYYVAVRVVLRLTYVACRDTNAWCVLKLPCALKHIVKPSIGHYSIIIENTVHLALRGSQSHLWSVSMRGFSLTANTSMFKVSSQLRNSPSPLHTFTQMWKSHSQLLQALNCPPPRSMASSCFLTAHSKPQTEGNMQ